MTHIPGVMTVHQRDEIFTNPCFPITGPAQVMSNAVMLYSIQLGA